MIAFELLGVIDTTKVSFIGLVKTLDSQTFGLLYYFDVIIDSQKMTFNFESKENAIENQRQLKSETIYKRRLNNV